MPPSTSPMVTLSPGDLAYFIGYRQNIGQSNASIGAESIATPYNSRTLAVSRAFGMHGYTGRQLTWQTNWSTVPSAISCVLQGSIDGSTWNTVDTSTNTAGETRYVSTDNLKDYSFFRINIPSLTGSAAGTVAATLM